MERKEKKSHYVPQLEFTMWGLGVQTEVATQHQNLRTVGVDCSDLVGG